MVESLIFIVGALILLAVFSRQWRTPTVSKLRPDERGQFRGVDNIFVNAAEYAFFQSLRAHCPKHFHILTKVRMEDVVGVSPDIRDSRKRFALRGRIKSRHIDFVIIDLSGCPLLAIELDGRVHSGAEQGRADCVKTLICTDAGLTLLRVKTGENFNVVCQDLFSNLTRQRIAT